MTVDELKVVLSAQTQGLQQGMQDAKSSVKGVGDAVEKVKEQINQSLNSANNDVKKSAKAQVSSLTTEYRKQGTAQSDAFKKSWNEIEKETLNGTQKVKNAISSIDDIARKTSQNMQNRVSMQDFGFGSGLSKTANKIRGLVSMTLSAAGAVGLVSLGKQAIELASDLQEVQNVVDTAFGDMASKIEEFAKTSIDNFGMSALSAKRTGSVYMAMAKGLGLASDIASDMSVKLTGLTGDMASFYNVSQDIADTALKSIFTGETESLKQFGIVMTQTNLQAFAYTQGISKTIAKMSQAELAQLRYKYVLQQTGMVQGDFAKTSDSWANQTRVLSERWKEFLAIIGNGVITSLTPALKVINNIIAALTTFANYFSAVMNALFGKSQEDTTKQYSNQQSMQRQLSNGVSNTTNYQKKLTQATKETGKAMQKNLAGFDQIQKLSKPATSTGGGSSDGGTSGGGDTPDVPQMPNILEIPNIDLSIVNKITEQIRKLLNVFKERPEVKLIANAFKTLWEKGVKPLGEWIIRNPDEFLNLLSSVALGFATWKTVTWVTNIAKLVGVATSGTGLAGFGSTLAALAGPAGWIALAVTALALLGVTLYEAGEKARGADLANRFGTITLSLQEIEDVAKSLTVSDLTVKIDLFLEEKTKISEIETSIQNQINELNKLNWRVAIGMHLTEDEQASYVDIIDNYIKSVDEYILQKQYVATLAVDIILQNTETGENLTKFINTYFGQGKQKLDKLGKDLRDTVNEAFADGVLSPEELTTITNLQKEMQLIVDRVSQAEFKAKLTDLKMQTSGAKLTAESFAEVSKKANAYISEEMSGLAEARIEAIKIAELQFAETGNEEQYKKALKAIESGFRQRKIDLSFKTYNFQMNTLQEGFKKELTKAEPIFKTNIKTAFKNGFTGGMSEEGIYTQPVAKLIENLQNAYGTELTTLDVSTETRGAMKDILKELKPTKAQYEEIAKAALKAGESVPEEVSKGLSEISAMEAITKGTNAINFKIGETLSSDEEFIKMLATSKNAGEQVNEQVVLGLGSSIEIVKDETGKVITGIKDKVTGQVTEITPTLVANLKQMGIDISDGVADGVKDEMEANEEKIKKVWWKPSTWFKKENEINSPSKLFKRYGDNLVEGLIDGIDSKMTSSETDTKTTFGKLNTWIKSTFGIEEGKNSSIFDGFGLNIIGGLLEGISTKWTDVTDWWDTTTDTWFTDDVKTLFTSTKWDIFSGIGTAFKEGFRKAINGAIGILNTGITTINSKLNLSWDALKIGGKEIVPAGSFNLGKISTIPTIPKLAQGAVVPPNREFMAILGDNKRETEIVSPLSTMKQAVAEVLAQSANGGGTQVTEIYNLNETELMRIIYRLVKGGERLKGKTLRGGAY